MKKNLETKYKAIFYGRVSTISDEQAESIDNQILQAKNLLSKREDIELIAPLETYCEKISGKTDERPKFQAVIECLESGAANLLIIKDLKRLSRSVMVTYNFFDKMEMYGFKIYLLSTNKILDAKEFEEAENMILLGVEAIIAENQVRQQSRYGKIYQTIRCENKILSYKDAQLFGYYWNYDIDGPDIDKEKAAIVVEIFDRYVFRREGIKEIRKYLMSIGYPVSATTVTKWLQEGKYVGDWTINRKSSRLQIGTGKKTVRFDLDKSEWVHISRPDLAIVDKAVFDLAQKIRAMNTRTTEHGQDVKVRFEGSHLFASKIFCGECGSAYRFDWADRNKRVAIYRDSFGTKRMDHLKCANQEYKRVYERDMVQITVQVYNAIIEKGIIDFDLLIKAIHKALEMCRPDENQKAKDKKKLIEQLERKLEKISDLFLEANDNIRVRLNKQAAEIGDRITELKKELSALEETQKEERNVEVQIGKIRDAVNRWRFISNDDVDRNMVKSFVKEIRIYKDGKVDYILASDDLIKFQLPHDPKGGPDKKDLPILLQQTEYEGEVKNLINQWRKKKRVIVPIMKFKAQTTGKKLDGENQKVLEVNVEMIIKE